MKSLKLYLFILMTLALTSCGGDNENINNSIDLDLLVDQWRFIKDVQLDSNGNVVDEYLVECATDEVIEFTNINYTIFQDYDCDGSADTEDMYTYSLGETSEFSNVIFIDGEAEGAITTLNDTTLIFIFIDSIDGDGNYVEFHYQRI